MRMLILSFLIFCFAVFANETVVIYQLEVIRLNEEIATKINLKDIQVEKLDSNNLGFQVIYDAKTMEILMKAPFITANLELGTKNEKTSISTRPWVSTIVGKPAVLFAATEELSFTTGLRTGVGMRIQLTPVNVHENKILTKIAFSDPYGPTVFDNEMWLSNECFSPICITTMKTEKETMYFAIYAKASLVSKLPENNIYMVGSVDELADMFVTSSADRISEVNGYVYTDFSQISGAVEASIWANDSLVVQSGLVIIPLSFVFGVEHLVSEDGLRAGAKFLYDSDYYLLLGVSDYSKISENFTLFAEFYPFKISLSQWKFESISWKVGARIDFEDYCIVLGAYKSGQINLWLEGRVRVYRALFLLVGIQYSLDNRIYLRAGISVEF